MNLNILSVASHRTAVNLSEYALRMAFHKFFEAEFGPFLLVPQQPKKLWTNRSHGRIQHVRKVQKNHQ